MATDANTRWPVLFLGSVYRCQGVLRLLVFTQLWVFWVPAGPDEAGDDTRHLARSGAMATDRPSPALR